MRSKIDLAIYKTQDKFSHEKKRDTEPVKVGAVAYTIVGDG